MNSKELLKRSLLFGMRTIRQNRFIKSIIEDRSDDKPLTYFNSFNDEFNNKIDLFKEIRGYIRPGWEGMLNPESAFYVPDDDDIQKKISYSQSLGKELSNILNTLSFSLSDKKVLEIGCYDGSMTYLLAKLGADEVCGSDYSPYYIHERTQNFEISEKNIEIQKEYLNKLRMLYKNNFPMNSKKKNAVHFIEDDICNSLIPSESFDLICSFEVLEHVQEPEKIFEQIYRILKPGGIAIHSYNPFFSLAGGHSLCTLDMYWGHAQLNEKDFLRYIHQLRPEEYDIASRFYLKNLNRMTLKHLKDYSQNSKLKIIDLIPWCEKEHFKMLDQHIVRRIQNIYPDCTITDLISPFVTLIQKKTSP